MRCAFWCFYHVVVPDMPLEIEKALGQDIIDKRIDILQKIDQCGSISEAARLSGVSYKAAWQAIETLNSLAGEPLVAKFVGGANRGGAVLTEAGRKVLEAASALNKIRSQLISDVKNVDHATLTALTSASLRMSIRNIVPCLIEYLSERGSKVNLLLKICPGQFIPSSITLESCQLLDLHEGKAVLALFKAVAANIVSVPPKESGLPYLKGVVSRAQIFPDNAELTLKLPNGVSVVGFASGNQSFNVGEEAFIVIPSESVVIALLG